MKKGLSISGMCLILLAPMILNSIQGENLKADDSLKNNVLLESGTAATSTTRETTESSSVAPSSSSNASTESGTAATSTTRET
ncbi:hypothetical protein, partial [Enterococcus raffinosus]|uniref:hypothetical protein n=1 Tax=Enterococcus raffinosus TaxID=71452 RepID=UPI003ACBB022